MAAPGSLVRFPSASNLVGNNAIHRFEVGLGCVTQNQWQASKQVMHKRASERGREEPSKQENKQTEVQMNQEDKQTYK